MAKTSVNTGAAGELVLDVFETSWDAAGNWSDVAWALYLNERTTSNSSWTGNPFFAEVGEDNVQQWWSGNTTYDWRGGGLQSQLIASGTNRVQHNSDGSKTITVGAQIASTGTTGAGGPTKITNTLALTDLTRLPNTPSGVAISRVSDNQTRVAWTNSGPNNGQATQNQIQAGNSSADPDGITTINAAGSANIAILPNEKKTYRVRAGNSAGWSAWSAWSSYIYTTPGAPSGATATKQANLDIVVAFTENVSYAEYNHEVWHGVVSGGVTTWDASALATVGAGVLTYTHTAPDPAQVHVYRVRAKQGALLSGYATTNAVQLVVAPNKPTLTVPRYANRAAQTMVSWVHNAPDTSPQQGREVAYSTDGGVNWNSVGRFNNSAQFLYIAANTYAAGTAVSVRVRTWGSATTGGSEGTGASPWSDISVINFRSLPSTTITKPANGSALNDATVRVTYSFTQAEGATFVKSQIELIQAGVTLESTEATNRVDVALDTTVDNGGSYSVRVRVLDSNGLWSPWVTGAFTVTYLAPVPAQVAVSYLEDTGYAQIDVIVPEPSSSQSAAVTLTVVRRINGVDEVLVKDYPVDVALTFLDTTPTTHGTNMYIVSTTSALGAQVSVSTDLVTEECRRAFLSKGPGFQRVGVFGANLEIDEDPNVASDTVEAAGRSRPIGLYGVEGSVQLKVKSFVYAGFGSTLDELRSILLIPGKACYRDPTGRRTFGTVKGSISRSKVDRGDFTFNLTETS